MIFNRTHKYAEGQLSAYEDVQNGANNVEQAKERSKQFYKGYKWAMNYLQIRHSE